MTKLIAIKLPDLPIGSLGLVRLAEPPERVRGWTVEVRGPAVFLRSPRGWEPGKPFATLDPKGPQTVYEVPRAECLLVWSDATAVDLDVVGKFSSDAMLRADHRAEAEASEKQAAAGGGKK